MSYAPGTLFRISTPDKSNHFTAVLLKDGKVLEVKNPHTGKKEIFPSLTMWRASHGASEEEVQVDASKGSGVVISSIADGFNYPTENISAYNWIRWCYSIVKEAAPQLLEVEEFKLAYNKMVEVCTKYKQELDDYRNYITGSNHYTSTNIQIINDKSHHLSRSYGFNIHFKYEQYMYSPYSGIGHKRYSKEDYEQARKELGLAYVAVVEIIKPHIENYMEKKYKVLNTKNQLSKSKAKINRNLRKIESLKASIGYCERNIKYETNIIDKLEVELVTAQAAIM